MACPECASVVYRHGAQWKCVLNTRDALITPLLVQDHQNQFIAVHNEDVNYSMSSTDNCAKH